MGMDRFINWKDDVPDWGRPTIERVAQVAREFLGPRWTVTITDPTWIVAECDERPSFHLRSEYIRNADSHAVNYVKAHDELYAEFTRGFEVFFSGEHGEDQTSIITRQADRFTSALADEFARIIAQWWHGEVEWPG